MCIDRLPNEKINPVTNDFVKYNVLFKIEFDNEIIYDVRTYAYGNNHWLNNGEIIDKYIVAWQPLPTIEKL